MKKYVFLVLLLVFVLIQVSTSFTKSNLYPFNAYRMFSKNWEEHQKMLEIEIVDNEGKRSYSKQHFRIPFFQSNRLMGTVFFFDQNPRTQQILCQHLLDSTASPLVYVQTLAATYHRNERGQMIRQTPVKDPSISCNRREPK